MHFVFQVLLTRRQYSKVLLAMVEELRRRCPPLVEIMQGAAKLDGAITRDMVEKVPRELRCMLGWDLCFLNNADQVRTGKGGALKFSHSAGWVRVAKGGAEISLPRTGANGRLLQQRGKGPAFEAGADPAPQGRR